MPKRKNLTKPQQKPMKTTLQKTLALLVLAAAGLAASAHAQLTWDWTISGASDTSIVNESVTGSGVITTASTTTGGNYLITGMSGSISSAAYVFSPPDFSQGGGTITGVSGSSYLSPNGNLSPGLDVLFGSHGSALISTSGGGYAYADSAITSPLGVTFTAHQAVVSAPEPSQVASMLGLAGVGGTGMLLRFRRRK